MPWTLTTPVETGDLDTVDYAELQIVRMTHLSLPDAESIVVDLQYGNTVNGVWVEGIAIPTGKAKTVTIIGTDYTDLITNAIPDVQTSDPSNPNYYYDASASVWVERTFAASKRGLYEWMYDNGYIDAGSVT
jgi:hypothetical protein